MTGALLSVILGDRHLSDADIAASLHRRCQLLPLLRGVAMETLIVDAARQAGLTVSNEELQNTSETLRRTLGLQSASKTQQWLTDERLSVEQFEHRVELDVLIEKFKDHLLARYGQQYFDATTENWTQFRLRRLTVASLNEARELQTQIEEEGAEFRELAARHSIDVQTRHTQGDLGIVLRHQLRPELKEMLSTTGAWYVSAPIHGPDGFELYFIEETISPVFDTRTQSVIREELLRNFISRKLGDVKIVGSLFDRSDTETVVAHAESGSSAPSSTL